MKGKGHVETGRDPDNPANHVFPGNPGSQSDHVKVTLPKPASKEFVRLRVTQ
jgi:hypothetical protein